MCATLECVIVMCFYIVPGPLTSFVEKIDFGLSVTIEMVFDFLFLSLECRQ